MKYKAMFILSIVVCLITGITEATIIEYQLTDLGSGQWEYSYLVENDTLTEPIEGFTIWFADEADQYQIVSSTPVQLDWDETMLLDVVGRGDGYDLLARGEGILPSQEAGGFAVQFDWTGLDEPGTQYYEILDPDTYAVIDFGYTVPEPTMIGLMGLGFAGLVRKRKTSR